MQQRRIRGATQDTRADVTLPIHDRVTVPVRQEPLISSNPPAPEPPLDSGTTLVEERPQRTSGIVLSSTRREPRMAAYSSVMHRLLTRSGAGLPHVGEQDLLRLREITERADAGKGVTAAELLWLGNLLTNSIGVTTIEAVALVEIIEALAHHAFDEPERAYQRLTRCAVLLLSVIPKPEEI
jgi:hypothetical protein